MANNLLSTVELISKANEVLSKHADRLNKAAVQMEALNTEYKKLPSDYIKAIKESAAAEKALNVAKQATIKTSKDLAALRAQEAKALSSELALKKQKEQAETAEAKAIQSKIPSFRQLAAIKKQKELQDKREQALLNRTTGLYNQIQQRVNKLTLEYNNLAAKRELGTRLTRNEASSLEFLQQQLNKYQSILKKVDANVGKHTRNVGNYASGWNGLSNSINQLTREMPAFANSAQTGFMALSNNIPTLVDEINRIVAVNKQLAAQGKPVTSAFKQIMKSLLSLQTLMGIGITLLVIYGKEIGEWVNSLLSADSALDETTKGVKAFDKETKSSIGRLKGLSSIVNDVTKSEEERLNALKSINKEYPELHTNLTLEKENLDKVNNAVKEYIRLAIQKKKLLILEEEIGEIITETVILQQELNKLTISENDFRVKSYMKIKNALKEENLTFKEKNSLMLQLNDAYTRLTPKQQKYISTSNKIEANERKINDIVEDYIDIEDHRDKKTTKTSRKRIKSLKEESKGIDSWVIAVKEQISQLKELEQYYGKNTKEGKYLASQIKALEKVLEPLSGEFDDAEASLEKFSEGMKNSEKIMKKLRAETDDFISGFSDDFIKSSSLSSLTVFFDGTFENLLAGAETTQEKFQVTFNAIAESAQQAFALINSFSEQNYDAQYERLENQRDTAILFAGESTAAITEIERQYEERRKQIARKQAEQQKETAIFNAVIDTAQAVVSALPNYALAAAVGVLGAAQIAIISSQKIPEYWQGGEVGNSQQIMVNDDPYNRKGSNYKEVIEEPSGKLRFPQGKNVKMTVPKGSFVHPTYDSFINSLDSELIGNNIMPVGQSNITPMIINNGLTKGEVMDVMNGHAQKIVNTINKQHGINISIDENGINKYIKKKQGTSKIMNSRYSGRGISV